jgi:hypothetical protein
MKRPRRKFLHLAAGAAALPAVSNIAWAQAYPTKLVRGLLGLPSGLIAQGGAAQWTPFWPNEPDALRVPRHDDLAERTRGAQVSRFTIVWRPTFALSVWFDA